ncbi:hypothetical protein PRIPAC_96120 [Pristionchus pacificus]|uniref:Uncharacterized protein n=1 Tax=Pristionchus pacificus TaxID=54126 RepID=A0A2A6BDJ4_PRIPA|nr:hypothetical protein PRIPAC_96120 [Pristionchus pacificus]|eukprot:PDM63980.1 hypothetical protein PRIPAC_49481 [Pristionchus pacificus]
MEPVLNAAISTTTFNTRANCYSPRLSSAKRQEYERFGGSTFPRDFTPTFSSTLSHGLSTVVTFSRSHLVKSFHISDRNLPMTSKGQKKVKSATVAKENHEGISLAEFKTALKKMNVDMAGQTIHGRNALTVPYNDALAAYQGDCGVSKADMGRGFEKLRAVALQNLNSLSTETLMKIVYDMATNGKSTIGSIASETSTNSSGQS